MIYYLHIRNQLELNILMEISGLIKRYSAWRKSFEPYHFPMDLRLADGHISPCLYNGHPIKLTHPEVIEAFSNAHKIEEWIEIWN